MHNDDEASEQLHDDGVAASIDRPASDSRGLAILAHGAGSDRESFLLRTLSAALTARGLTVARIDLAYRQQRPKGPPSPSKAAADRDGIRAAVAALRPLAPSGPLIIGGQSYGGRQASMVVAEDSGLADGLLLTSYPLHPPGKPEKLRTEHLPDIVIPAVIVHGRSDSFATSDEITAAADLFAGPAHIVEVDRGDHGLRPEKSGVGELTAAAVEQHLLSGAP